MSCLLGYIGVISVPICLLRSFGAPRRDQKKMCVPEKNLSNLTKMRHVSISGALSGKLLLVGIVKNNKIVAYFRAG